MQFEFLTPIEIEVQTFIKQLSPNHLGSKVSIHTPNAVPNLDDVKIAIIGVLDGRGAHQEIHYHDLINIRKSFYSLFPGNWDVLMADLGNIKKGNTLADTYFALEKVIENLLKKKIIPIIIGGTQDLTYPMYRAFDNLDQMVNLVCIDSKFDFGSNQNHITYDSYLSKIIINEPHNLFNFSNIGYQSYYNPQEDVDLIEKMYFEAYRLGEVSNNLTIAEPVLRDADVVSIDMNVVKSSDSGNLNEFIPNGLDGKQICGLTRYAGISDKVSLLGIFNHQNFISESHLIAQMMWYFIEGINYRSNDYPYGSKNHYTKYIVPIDSETIVFYKSNKSERWWIEIPFFSDQHNKLKKHTLLPCSYEEYIQATNQEIPERWWKTQRKNVF